MTETAEAAATAPTFQRRARRGAGWMLASAVIAGLILAPVVALIWQAAQGSDGLWQHLAAYVLPHALGQTAMLMAGVTSITRLFR